MNTEPENPDRLLKLLALKRHEQPPPGYFEHLPREVMARLRAGSFAGSSRAEEMMEELSWLRRVWAMLEGKPVLTGAFGAGVCALLLSGLLYLQQPGRSQVAGDDPEQDRTATALLVGHRLSPGEQSSTNPIADALVPAALFDGAFARRQQARANFFVPAGN
jgi:hypothetical protein